MSGIQPDKKTKKIIGVIAFLLSIVVALTAVIMGNVSWPQVLGGMSGAIAVWFSMNWIASWIDSSVADHHRETTSIFEMLAGKLLHLIDERREWKDSRFYSQFYHRATRIRISAIAHKPFAKYLCDPAARKNFGIDHLLEQMKTRKIVVDVLLMNPYSPIIEEKDLALAPDGSVSTNRDDILSTVSLLREWSKNLNKRYRSGQEAKFFGSSSLHVRLCRAPLNTTLFCCDEMDAGPFPAKGGVVLMGMLYARKEGEESQLFKIPPADDGSAAGLRADLVDHFDELFRSRSDLLLKVSKDGVEFREPIQNRDGTALGQDTRQLREMANQKVRSSSSSARTRKKALDAVE
jgi:hypothetical protein